MLLPSCEFMTPLKADVAPPFAAVMFDPDAASNPTLAWLDSATGPVEVTGIDRVDGGYVASLSVRGKLEIPMTELAMVCSERTLLQAKPNPYWPRMWQHLAPKQWMEWLVVSGSGDGLRYVADGWGGVINDKIYSGQDGETSAALVDMLTPFDPLRARVARAGAYHAAVSAYAENQPAPLCSGNWMNSTVKDWTRRSLERWGSDGQAPVVPTPLIANVPAKSARDLKAIKEWCATRSVPAFDPSGRSPWVAVGAAVWPYDTERMDARGEWPKSVAPPDRGFTPAFCDGLRRAVTAGEDFGAWGPWVESEALPLCAVAEPLWPRFLSDAVDAAMTIQGWKHAPAVECRVPVGVAPVSVQIPPDLPAGTKSVPAYLFTPELPPGWVPTYDPSIVASKDSRLDFGVVFSEDQVAEVYQ
jgi:hypothetical protein